MKGDDGTTCSYFLLEYHVILMLLFKYTIMLDSVARYNNAMARYINAISLTRYINVNGSNLLNRNKGSAIVSFPLQFPIDQNGVHSLFSDLKWITMINVSNAISIFDTVLSLGRLLACTFISNILLCIVHI